ncbi:methylisocitrate lyase [Methanolinea mesophila]|uniref:isocitrate lyase/PEP mutase family protein n=1 Tax=Methanolinea mesophila TaxID=547055 RepID=UPI001AEA5E5C|nr:oxaloacetate decarboxylase [Methanolinea mesophila]MBP1929788.1 methylisocitrate lyase [Methanolinea mesophila]
MTTRFKELLYAEEILAFPVSHDPLCAKIAELSGFAAVSVGGYASSASMLAKPDINLLTLTEMADVVRRTVNAVNIPVFADGDTGHGNVNNVKRTVELFEQAGAASLFIEDQVSPKRCGHMAGKEVIPPREMEAKIEAALDARKDPDLLIMARTDAIAVNGIDDAIARAGSYLDAGADFIFIEAPENVPQMRRITREIDAPNLANMLPGGKTPLLTAPELQEIGFAAVAFPTVCTHTIAKSVMGVLRDLRATGTLAGLEERMLSFDEFGGLVGLDRIRSEELAYCRDCR